MNWTANFLLNNNNKNRSRTLGPNGSVPPHIYYYSSSRPLVGVPGRPRTTKPQSHSEALDTESLQRGLLAFFLKSPRTENLFLFPVKIIGLEG